MGNHTDEERMDWIESHIQLTNDRMALSPPDMKIIDYSVNLGGDGVTTREYTTVGTCFVDKSWRGTIDEIMDMDPGDEALKKHYRGERR